MKKVLSKTPLLYKLFKWSSRSKDKTDIRLLHLQIAEEQQRKEKEQQRKKVMKELDNTEKGIERLQGTIRKISNEEKHLKNALASIKNLADEIIVVDTGSTDTTKGIASQFTQKIYDYAWNDNFADARNFSLQHATSDWILVLDADETLSKVDNQRIVSLIKEAPKEISGFILTQRNYLSSKEHLNLGKINFFGNPLYIIEISRSLLFDEKTSLDSCFPVQGAALTPTPL